MNNCETTEYYTEEQLQQPQGFAQPVPLSIFFAMMFVIGAISVSELPGFNYAVIGLGVLASIAFIMSSLSSGFSVAPELKCYSGFIFWGILGIFFVKYPQLQTEKIRTLIQVLVMTLILSYYAKNVRSTKWLLLSVLLGITIISIVAVYTGDFARAEGEGEEARLAGLLGNSNAFAIASTYATIIVLYVFRVTKSMIFKAVAIGLILLFAKFVIASGSRKGFISFAIAITAWFFFSYRKELFKRPHVAIATAMVIAAVGAYVIVGMQDSVLMKRLSLGLQQLEGDSYSGGVGARKQMIKEGIDMTLSSPIMGVGLNHFRVYSSSGLFSHNNYAEVFSNTGIPGGLLYQMIYIIFLIRLIKLSKCDLTSDEKEMLNIAKVYFLVRILLDMGVVSYSAKIDWIMLSIFIGFTFNLQNELKARYAQQMLDEQYMYEQQESETSPAETLTC